MADYYTQIDAVITWVNGNDPEHLSKRRKYALTGGEHNRWEVPTGRDDTRFTDNGELEYCIHSIREFAPWIRRIHLVTDNQIPPFLTPELRRELNVQIVDHRQIFAGFKYALPTFNTRTIETALWRIPNLADHFIYFNDDFILTGHVDPSDFFSAHKVVLRGNWNTITSFSPVIVELNRLFSLFLKKLFGITRSMHLLLQMKSARFAGFEKRYFRVPHIPHPVRTRTLERFFSRHPELFEKNIRFRFRNTGQFSAIFLAHHLEISRNNAILMASCEHILINGELDTSIMLNRKLNLIKDGHVRFVCLQGFENFRDEQQSQIRHLLDDLTGIKEPTPPSGFGMELSSSEP
ncbi:MAG: stealth family protein [Cyclonatronaceae bacterium]